VKKRKTKRTLPALSRRIASAVLILWLACMYAVTAVTAESFYVHYVNMGQDFMENAWSLARFSDRLDGDAPQLPGYTEYVLWGAIRGVAPSSSYGVLSMARHTQVLRTEAISADSIVAVFDPEGNPVASSGNYFLFPYNYEEPDAIAELPPEGYAVCVLDRQLDEETAQFFIDQMTGVQYEALCYRFTGVLENGYFTVHQASFCRKPDLGNSASGWIDIPGLNDAAAEGTETVTLYTKYIEAQKYKTSRPFHYAGAEVRDLGKFMSDLGPIMENWQQATQFSLTDFVYTQALYYHDWSDWDGTAENSPELEYRLAVAILASPWRSAMTALGNVYLVTLLIGLAGSLWLRKTLRRHVTQPVAAVNEGMAKGFVTVRDPDDPPLKYTEVAELTAHYEETKTRLAHNKDTIARLEKAVNYAQEAEENRRQMTSSIAHELKTPLAVIHSYAEGLRERIAEEKREKYLDVILSETERMDGMVLEMLDLSRLEAGKVRLLREDFSLSELTAAVFERLARAAEAKALRLTFELEKDCIIRADPARIEQVITNFAVNAVKYTPSGGSIRVYTARNRNSGVTLTVENDSEPLSREALSKVWDTFYRADESRTGAGTGLGLAIAKSIIDLHGGKCWVRNTKTGVAFSFELEA
jgi:signal transduction histidine kinase